MREELQSPCARINKNNLSLYVWFYARFTFNRTYLFVVYGNSAYITINKEAFNSSF
jgi:hypothetical protein